MALLKREELGVDLSGSRLSQCWLVNCRGYWSHLFLSNFVPVNRVIGFDRVRRMEEPVDVL